MCLKSIGKKFRYLMHGDVTDGCQMPRSLREERAPLTADQLLLLCYLLLLSKDFTALELKANVVKITKHFPNI